MKTLVFFIKIVILRNVENLNWWMFIDTIRKYQINRLKSSYFVTLPILEKLKNLIFKESKIPKTLNIDDLRTPGVKSITLHTTRKLIKCFWKIFGKKKFTFTAFDILLFEFMFILTSALQSTGNERVRVWVENHKNIHILL